MAWLIWICLRENLRNSLADFDRFVEKFEISELGKWSQAIACQKMSSRFCQNKMNLPCQNGGGNG